MSTSPTMPTLSVMPARSPLLPHWRDLQRQLSGWAAGQADPHAELLALVWGPTWDWAQARQISDSARLPVQALAPVAQAFEASPPPHQQRLRQLILRHRRRHAPARWENAAPCPASC